MSILIIDESGEGTVKICKSHDEAAQVLAHDFYENNKAERLVGIINNRLDLLKFAEISKDAKYPEGGGAVIYANNFIDKNNLYQILNSLLEKKNINGT